MYGTRPTIRKVIFASKLRSAREAAGLSVEEVAARASVDKATIYRYESGHTVVKPDQLPFYAELYGVGPEVLELWNKWAKEAKVRGPWAASGSTIGPTYRDFADAESLGKELRMWEMGVVPGLLQTTRYSEAVIQTAATVHPGQLPSEEKTVQELTMLRESRKAILNRDSHPRIWTVLGEAAVLTPPSATDPDVHREQIQHLLNLGETAASIQVLPMRTGLHGGLSGSFTIISFEDEPDKLFDMVFREGYGDGSFIDGKEPVRAYRARYERLQSQALSILDTRLYLHELLKSI